jgi:hypothetical protein
MWRSVIWHMFGNASGFFSLSGVGLSPLGTAATSGLLYKPQMIDAIKIGRENRSTRRKLAPAPLCQPQIPHDQTRARTRATTVGSQQLTAWAMARPCFRLPYCLHVLGQRLSQKSLAWGRQTIPPPYETLLLDYIVSHPIRQCLPSW